MKKLLFALLACLSLTACNVRKTGDIKDIANYETRIYCSQRNNNVCNHCDSWESLDEEKLHKAKSVTCTNLTSDSYYPHYHYCVTWVI